MSEKKTQTQIKSELHPRSKHRFRYNFKKLIERSPQLSPFVAPNKYGDMSVNFFDAEAVKALNKALLKFHYNIDYWEIPKHHLCPPIPGRADYIHYIADLINDTSKNTTILGLDIGTGANCIYPIIGHQTYSWSFIGSEIDENTVLFAKEIVDKNKDLKGKIDIRLQENKVYKFKDVLKPNESITFSMCNPPFHASAEDAKKATQRKLKNLKGKQYKSPILNFGGQHNELWCKGGEARFIKDMIFESKHYGNQCKWFTSLVSKASNLKGIYSDLKNVNTKQVKTIEMGQGQKISRIVAWTFQDL